MTEAARPGASRIPLIAAVLAGSALLSRLLGWMREIVLAGQLGTTPEADAYRAAFQVPDILNHFLAGGAFSVAFVPLYTRVRASRGEAAAKRLLATVLGTVTLAALLLTAALWLAADPVVSGIFHDFAPDKQALTVRLTRIVLPAQVFFVAGGIVRAALMAHDRFATQALAPLVYNAGIIAGGIGLGATLGAEGFAWGALVGAFIGTLLLPLLDARRAGLSLGFRVAPGDADFRRYLWLAAPLVLGISLMTLDEWYDRYFGQFVGDGAIAQLGYARFVMLLPVAFIGQALATAALPALSRLWSEGRHAELDRALQGVLQASLVLAVLAGAGAFALARPIVAVVYERGAFTPEDTRDVAALLAVFAFAVPAWIALQVAGRGFFAREDMWRPMLLGTGIAVAAFPLYGALGESRGAEGVAAAGVIAMSVNAVALLAMLRRVHGGPPLLPLLTTGARAGLLAVPAGLAASLAAGAADAPLGALLFGMGAFGSVAIPGIWLLGGEEVRDLLRRAGRRLARRRDG